MSDPNIKNHLIVPSVFRVKLLYLRYDYNRVHIPFFLFHWHFASINTIGSHRLDSDNTHSTYQRNSNRRRSP